MVKSTDTSDPNHLKNASDQGLQGSQDRHNRVLVSSVNPQNHPMFGSFTAATEIPITQNHHFGEFGKRVIYDSTSIRERPKVPLSYYTKWPGPRVKWTRELHDRFVEVINELGGPHNVGSDFTDELGFDDHDLRF